MGGFEVLRQVREHNVRAAADEVVDELDRAGDIDWRTGRKGLRADREGVRVEQWRNLRRE